MGASRGKVGQLGAEPADVIEQLCRTVALHPLFEEAHMGLVPVHLAHRYLVRAPIVLGALAIDLFRTGPTLGCAEHDHQPAGAFPETISTRSRFDALYLLDDLIH